ncbi:hypothetical protein LZ017_03850 [Pelomonas sp. CA6]|uniref:hypothetical protein n=1 Tax=Pelomonas sp. CA6 TaxID=2907999 RepID=UPI001F4B16EE|nr:hypothetical protein [Pelomonas sp. CA6]MCH7342511.1 hypothetical protein [Pelomonas sp. CA6]
MSLSRKDGGAGPEGMSPELTSGIVIGLLHVLSAMTDALVRSGRMPKDEFLALIEAQIREETGKESPSGAAVKAYTLGFLESYKAQVTRIDPE